MTTQTTQTRARKHYIRCPYPACGAPFEIEKEHFEKTHLYCPYCNTLFVLQDGQAKRLEQQVLIETIQERPVQRSLFG